MIDFFYQDHFTRRDEATASLLLLNEIVAALEERFVLTISLRPTIYTAQGVLAPGQAAFVLKTHFAVESRLEAGLPGTEGV